MFNHYCISDFQIKNLSTKIRNSPIIISFKVNRTKINKTPKINVLNVQELRFLQKSLSVSSLQSSSESLVSDESESSSFSIGSNDVRGKGIACEVVGVVVVVVIVVIGQIGFGP